jgi:hypothetical protein
MCKCGRRQLTNEEIEKDLPCDYCQQEQGLISPKEKPEDWE